MMNHNSIPNDVKYQSVVIKKQKKFDGGHGLVMKYSVNFYIQ